MRKILGIVFVLGFILAVVFGILGIKDMREEAKHTKSSTLVASIVKLSATPYH